MDQAQVMQRPAPMGMEQPQASQNTMPKKKSKWLLWVIIILALLLVGVAAWWFLTP